MKTIIKFMMILPLVALLSCVGRHPQGDGGANYFVKLLIDKKQVNVDKAENAVFTIVADGQDVTSKAYIVNTTDGKYDTLKNADGSYSNQFKPSKSGVHSFIAVYDNNKSITANFRAIRDSHSNVFFRRSCVMKYTGTWCTFCPAMGDAIKEVAHTRPDRIVEISVQCEDKLTVPIGTLLQEYTKAYTLPEVMVDYRSATKVVNSSPNLIMSEIDNATVANPTVAGLKMSTKQVGQKIEIETETKVTQEGEYKLVAAILVDGFMYPQTGTSDPKYRQNSVLMAYLGAQDIWGNDLGRIAANQSVAKNFTYDLPVGAIDISRYRVALIVLNKMQDGAFRVNNIIECNVGQSSDYEYDEVAAQ